MSGEMDVLLEAVQKLTPIAQDANSNIATLFERVATVKGVLEKINERIFIGDHVAPPLVNQIVELTANIQSLTKDMTTLQLAINNIAMGEQELEKIRISNKNTMWIAVVGAISSIIVAAIGAWVIYLTHFGAK